jgi:hypothetical protein
MTYSGHIYQFEHSPTMAAGSWLPVGAPVAGNDSEKTFLHLGGASGTRRFYRVAIDP